MAWDRLHQQLASRAGWEDHDGELPVVEGTLIRLAVDHLPGDRNPEPLWLWSSRTGTDAAAVDRTWQAFLRRFDIERDFRHIKADDPGLRPVFHRPGKRVKGHVLICMLAAYLTWHLRQAWAPLTYTDEEPPAQANPVAPARRSASAGARASRQHDDNGRPYRSFPGLLAHLATLTRNDLRFPGTPSAVPVLTDPTPEQRQAFDLIGAAIPLTLRK